MQARLTDLDIRKQTPEKQQHQYGYYRGTSLVLVPTEACAAWSTPLRHITSEHLRHARSHASAD